MFELPDLEFFDSVTIVSDSVSFTIVSDSVGEFFSLEHSTLRSHMSNTDRLAVRSVRPLYVLKQSFPRVSHLRHDGHALSHLVLTREITL